MTRVKARPSNRLTDQKTATLEEQIASLTAAFELQRLENAKLKAIFAQTIKDRNESIAASPMIIRHAFC